MVKKMDIEGLATITANGFKAVDKRFDEVDKRFDEVDKRFDEVDKRFDEVDKRFDRIENILLRDHLNRIERLEDTVLRLKVKAGIR
jgi:tetrahydromethanopterin S-methyltransferase subunit G